MSAFKNPPKSPFFKGGLSKAFLNLMTLGYSFQVAGYGLRVTGCGLRVTGYEFQVSNLRLVSIFVLKPSKHYATF
ncbi:MAG: hypothetical protein PVI45_05680, partial [Desulfobacterales bacterium]